MKLSFIQIIILNAFTETITDTKHGFRHPAYINTLNPKNYRKFILNRANECSNEAPLFFFGHNIIYRDIFL
jgi:hypothetical protein